MGPCRTPHQLQASEMQGRAVVGRKACGREQKRRSGIISGSKFSGCRM